MRQLISMISIVVLALLCSIPTFSQKVDFNKIVQPVDQIASDFEEFLVQLAWINNPSNDVLQQKLVVAESELKTAKKGWLEAINFNLGYNPVGATQINSEDDLIVYPQFSYGFGLTMQALTQTPGKIQVAKANINIARSEMNQEKLKIRSEVLRRYRKYLLAEEIIRLRTQMEEDAKSSYDYITQLFRSNEAELDELNSAYSTYYGAVEQKITAKAEVEITKILVEEIIGITLEDAHRYIPDNE